ncbi:muscle M-line assembly protein unc-89-like [Tribolium madens]|uniref:muscle M-line assembly protein unc-89-like n=1 Tax=Tribolium madens TaxID=41895 RepID=UPI001CF75981|nr:muscle M-line assembly protein unc-89-like [Tribolium madens]
MPRKTPVKELQKDEPVVASPLRRSSRLSSSSPVPTKVISRRNSASEATTSTPKATRGRRSSFSQELESAKEKTTTKGSMSTSVEEEEPANKPRTRSSSATKELTTEVKRTTRRRSSITDETDVVEDKSTTRSTRSRTGSLTKSNSVGDLKITTKKQTSKKSEIPVVTPIKKSPSNETVNTNLEPIDEDELPEADESVKTKKALKLEITKLDLDLSVINEASLTEEDASPEKKRKTDESNPENVAHLEKKNESELINKKSVDNNTKEVQEKLTETTATKETKNAKSDLSDSEHSFTLQLSVSTCENSNKSEMNTNSSNKENVCPKIPVPETEFEPMDVDDEEIDILFNEAQDKFNSFEKVVREKDPVIKEEVRIVVKNIENVENHVEANNEVKKKESNESVVEKENIKSPVKKLDTPVKQAVVVESNDESVEHTLKEKISCKKTEAPDSDTDSFSNETTQKVNGIEETTKPKDQVSKETAESQVETQNKELNRSVVEKEKSPEKEIATPIKHAFVVLENIDSSLTEKISSKKLLERPTRKSPRINSPRPDEKEKLESPMEKVVTPVKQVIETPTRRSPRINSPRLDAQEKSESLREKVVTPEKQVTEITQNEQKGRSSSPKKTPTKNQESPKTQLNENIPTPESVKKGIKSVTIRLDEEETVKSPMKEVVTPGKQVSETTQKEQKGRSPSPRKTPKAKEETSKTELNEKRTTPGSVKKQESNRTVESPLKSTPGKVSDKVKSLKSPVINSISTIGDVVEDTNRTELPKMLEDADSSIVSKNTSNDNSFEVNISEKECKEEDSVVNEKTDSCDKSQSDITDKENTEEAVTTEDETEKSQEVEESEDFEVNENKQVTPEKEQEIFEAESESEEDYASPVKKIKKVQPQYNSVSDDEVFASKNKSRSDSIFERSIDSKYCFIQRSKELTQEKEVSTVVVSDSEEEISSCDDVFVSTEKGKDTNVAKEAESLNSTLEKDDENRLKPKSEDVMSQSMCKRLSDRVSICLQETIKADEDKETNLSGRIHNMVDYFCSTIKTSGDVSINVSMEYAANNSENEDKSDMIEISMIASDVTEEEKPVDFQKGSKRRKICKETPNKEDLKLVEDEEKMNSAKKTKKRGSLVADSPKPKSTPWKKHKNDTSLEESQVEDSGEDKLGYDSSKNFEKFLNESWHSDDDDVSWKPDPDATHSELSTDEASDSETDASDEVTEESLSANEKSKVDLDEDKKSKKTRKLFSISNYMSETLPSGLFADTEDENEDKTAERQPLNAKKSKKEKVATFTESKTGKKLVPEASEVGKKNKKRKHSMSAAGEEIPIKAKVIKKEEAELQNVISVAFKPSTGKSKKKGKSGYIKPSTRSQAGWDVEIFS